MVNVKLKSSDGDVFNVDFVIVKRLGTIKDMFESLGINEDDEDDEEAIAIPNVNSLILKKIIEWATHHKDDPPAPELDEDAEKPDAVISTWDANFLKVDQGILFDLILAANYLDIKELLEMACKSTAHMIANKTAEQIRKHFNIDNDFTAAEEDQLRKEFKWFHI